MYFTTEEALQELQKGLDNGELESVTIYKTIYGHCAYLIEVDMKDTAWHIATGKKTNCPSIIPIKEWCKENNVKVIRTILHDTHIIVGNYYS